MYHMFGGVREGQMRRYACAERDFERQMSLLSAGGYAVLNLEDVCEFIAGRPPFPERSTAITMDDGFMDNYEIAAPILKRHGFSSTMFVVPGLVGKTNEWMRGKDDAPRRLMGWKEIREIADHGIRIGSHTLSHADLTKLGPMDLEREVSNSKKEIEDRIGRPVSTFAYPFGLFNERVKEAVERAGYRAACTTNSGFNGPGEDRYALRRIEVYGTDTLRRFRRKLAFGVNDAPVSLSVRYYADRVRSRAAGLAAGMGAS